MHACHINGIQIGAGAPVRVMGVINCSPESFFSGSFIPPENVYSVAVRMRKQGADLIDIGARSTAPDAPPLSPAREAERMDRALSDLDGSGIPVSVDTIHPEVLDICISHEIHAVNDISGLSNPDLARMISDAGIPAILMASFREPGDATDLSGTLRALALVQERCSDHRIDEYVLDPGIGRWTDRRTPEADWTLCRHFSDFCRFDRPLLAAVSRKSFIGDLLGKAPADRLAGTLAVTALLVERGASMVRCHDVAETVDLISCGAKMREDRG